MLGAVIDGEDHNPVMIDGAGGDEMGIRNDQLTSAGNPA